MSITLHPATPTPQITSRIAKIHQAAFATNGLLLAQLPTPTSRAGLRTCLIDKAEKEIRDPQWEIFVARLQTEHHRDESDGEEEGDIIAFAKWRRPISIPIPIPGSDSGSDSGKIMKKYEEEPWVWPPGADFEVIDGWSGRVERAWERVCRGLGVEGGEGGCYRISFIATHPEYERLGAARMLVNCVLERARRENVPVLLESTVEAVGFYEKMGFRSEGDVEMVLNGRVYREECLVFRPV